MMKLSRFVFGLGGESLNMALNTYIVTWFRGREINLVFGLQLSLSRVGSTVNFLVMEKLYRSLKESHMASNPLKDTLLVASCFTFMSLICSLLLGLMDRKREAELHDNDKAGEGQAVSAPTNKMRLTDIKQFPLSFWLLCFTALSYYGSVFPFVSLAQGMFQTKYKLDADSANLSVGLVYLIAACGSPVLGWLLDRQGEHFVTCRFSSCHINARKYR